MSYRKWQFGWIVTSILMAVLAFTYFAHAYQWGNNPIPAGPFSIMQGLLLFVMVLFYKLTVEIDGAYLKRIYGIGIIRL